LLPLHSGRSQSYSGYAIPSWRHPLGGAPFHRRRISFLTPPLTRLEGEKAKASYPTAPQSLAGRRTGFTRPRTKERVSRHRPLWGLSPRRCEGSGFDK
jgi:hypothetical protein